MNYWVLAFSGTTASLAICAARRSVTGVTVSLMPTAFQLCDSASSAASDSGLLQHSRGSSFP